MATQKFSDTLTCFVRLWLKPPLSKFLDPPLHMYNPYNPEYY